MSPPAVRAWRALLLALVLTVSYLAMSPQPPPDISFGWDKLNHLVAFTALAFTSCMSCPNSRRWRLVLLAALVGFGGLIEVVQLFVPGRSSEWVDLLADSIGIAFGASAGAAWLWALSTLPARR